MGSSFVCKETLPKSYVDFVGVEIPIHCIPLQLSNQHQMDETVNILVLFSSLVLKERHLPISPLEPNCLTSPGFEKPREAKPRRRCRLCRCWDSRCDSRGSWCRCRRGTRINHHHVLAGGHQRRMTHLEALGTLGTLEALETLDSTGSRLPNRPFSPISTTGPPQSPHRLGHLCPG